ncbi:IS66 family insertion sequence element accessory protein TnpA [Nannocystis pusilla]|uniref:IS66 family insertion sequence element accessory protein TnpA n=1 Tax=Nannocystis pusilla TaxID=889268 RepID=UPI003DA4F9F0
MAQEVRPVSAVEDRWRPRVAAWSASGLPCKDFAAKAKLNPRTLAWWKSKLKTRDGAMETFVEVTKQLEVTAATEAGSIELVVGRVVIRVRGQVEAGTLKRVLEVVEATA